MPEGDEPSALRWMAAKAEFPCGLPGGGVAIGAAPDVLWGELASALWWMQWDVVLVVWGLAVFVEGFLLTFAGGVVILKVHIWEHSGPFGYLIPIWLVV